MAKRTLRTPNAQRRTSRRPDRVQTAASAPVDFAAVLESSPDIVYVLDLEGNFVYLSARAYEVFGYDRSDGSRFLGGSPTEIMVPGTNAPAVAAIRHRVEFPRDRQVFRVEGRHKDGRAISLEVHGGPVWREGRIIGRMGVCRVLEQEGREGVRAKASEADGLQHERMRIARGLRDAIAQVVFGVTPDRDASEAFLTDVKRATRADLARRLQLDEVDLEILRLVAAGGSNREIGSQVHLSPAAIKDRISRLMTRLGARRRAELAAHALRLGVA
jgi:PAS domain S-box-containing protein